MFKIKVILSFLLAVMLLVSMAVPVFAIADPDDPPSVNAVYIYENLLEDGDVGIFVDYFIDYTIAGIPTETVAEAYLVVFIDTDGITQLRSVAPYAFDNTDKGYGRGIAWIYFNAADTTLYGLDSANIALHKVWLTGNPTVASGWPGDPPKTIADIDLWQTTGDQNILLALRVLSYAQILSTAWGEILTEVTPLGNRLTTLGATYFTNAITDLQEMAPNAFSSGEVAPTQEDLDYEPTFGAIMTDGTGTVAGASITLAEGANTETVTATGTFILELEKGTVGTAASVAGGSVVTGSPVDLVWGTNTITASNAGTGDILITVNLQSTQVDITTSVSGTALDLSDPAALFGMSTMMFSGMVWIIISIVICAALYGVQQREQWRGGGKIVMLVFDLCIIGGAILGLLPVVVAVLLFIAFGAFTAYILFYRSANI